MRPESLRMYCSESLGVQVHTAPSRPRREPQRQDPFPAGLSLTRSPGPRPAFCASELYQAQDWEHALHPSSPQRKATC